MQIKEECVREILGYIVKNIDYKNDVDHKLNVVPVSLYELYNDKKLSEKYEQKDIMYTVLKLLEIHFIKVSDIFPQNKSVIERCTICEVTYSGHKFYESIQPEPIWNKTKSVISKIGVHTLDFIEGVAHDIAIESAKQAVTISMMKTQ